MDDNHLAAPLSAQPSSSASSAASSSHSRSATSPMSVDALDYFSETAARLGNNGGSTGVMIQSPDGRPAGIFFHPRTTSASTLNSHSGSTGHRTPASAGSGSGARSRRRSSGEESITATLAGAASRAAPAVQQQQGAANGEEQGIAARIKSSSAPPDASSSSSSSADSSPPTSGRSHISPNPLMSVDANGNLFQPQVELQSLLSGQRPPTATPLVPDGSGSTGESIPLTGLSSDRSRHESSCKPKSRAAADSANDIAAAPQLSPDGVSPLAKSAQSRAVADQNTIASPQGKASMRTTTSTTDGSNARQTFSFAAPSAVARPSAQPQSGLLIGAGFANPRRRGTLGARQTAASIEVLPPIKVLVVEDNPINLNILTKFFTQRKIKYGIARDGREAVNEWRTGGYHLILMDIQLPIMSGIEATKEIRRLEQQANIGPFPSATPSVASSSNSTKELTSSSAQSVVDSTSSALTSMPSAAVGSVSPSTMLQNSLRASVIIVALTASVLNSDRVAALAAGCNDFLNKPVNLRWLERKVIEWGSMQYLIGFRDLPDSYYRRNGGRDGAAAAAAARRLHLSPTDKEVMQSDGLVGRAFSAGPDKLARELAGRLYIGKKARPAATAGGAQ